MLTGPAREHLGPRQALSQGGGEFQIALQRLSEEKFLWESAHENNSPLVVIAAALSERIMTQERLRQL